MRSSLADVARDSPGSLYLFSGALRRQGSSGFSHTMREMSSGMILPFSRS